MARFVEARQLVAQDGDVALDGAGDVCRKSSVRDDGEGLREKISNIVGRADKIHRDKSTLDEPVEKMIPEIDMLDTIIYGAFFDELEGSGIVAEHLNRELDLKVGVKL